MKNSFLLALLCVITAISSYVGYTRSLDESTTKKQDITKENLVSVEEASITLVTFGERISDERAYFYQWEAQSETKRKQLVEEETFFLFNVEEYKKDSNQKLINLLIEKQKTVLFYGYHMDVESTLSQNSSIPFYKIVSNKEIYNYLYGYGYSVPNKTMIPITVMGNFSKEKMDEKIISYLLSHIEKHLTKTEK